MSIPDDAERFATRGDWQAIAETQAAQDRNTLARLRRANVVRKEAPPEGMMRKLGPTGTGQAAEVRAFIQDIETRAGWRVNTAIRPKSKKRKRR
jgi:hypothetical protein